MLQLKHAITTLQIKLLEVSFLIYNPKTSDFCKETFLYMLMSCNNLIQASVHIPLKHLEKTVIGDKKQSLMAYSFIDRSFHLCCIRAY